MTSMGRQDWPPERRRKLLLLIEKGRTMRQLAGDLGVSYPAVDSYCWRHGLRGRILKCKSGPKRLIHVGWGP